VAIKVSYIFQIHDNAMWGNQTPRKFPYALQHMAYLHDAMMLLVLRKPKNWHVDVNLPKPVYQTSHDYGNKGQHKIVMLT
jgi:hypothetical protein